MNASEKVVREKPIPEVKKSLVKELVGKVSEYRTVLVASCKGLPGKQFHEIKKKLRGKAEVKVAKKNILNRVIDNIEKGAIKNLKEQIGADIVVLFSNLDPFELSGLLAENQSFRKARPGDISPKDIEVEAGPTDLPPGPAISELGSVGLKVAVKDGKLEIMHGAVVAHKGEEIKENVASVLGKLNIAPLKVGFSPIAAYDKEDDAVYVGISIDKEGTLKNFREMIGKALGFAMNVGYPAKETIIYIIAKASTEERALAKLVGEEKPAEEKSEKKEEKIDESKEESAVETQENNKKELTEKQPESGEQQAIEGDSSDNVQTDNKTTKEESASE